ncbi:MAG: zinc-binding alcohol dehydrogenase [Betaproteobacteria bacterium]|nr:zinc-binding alcohol dehydrogenase [Betaproteobacteria bacterium]
MQSYWIVPDGKSIKLELREAPVPQPKTGELLVKVAASSFNRGELIPGHGVNGVTAKPGGGECAGIVEKVGDNARDFQSGQRVMGRCGGGFSEYALMDAREAMPVPDRLSWEEAAATPLVFLVVHDMLIGQGGLQRGEWLLVTSISSGVGVAALQTAKALGAKVIGTSGSADKLAKLKSMGLDVGIETRKGNFYDAVMAATDKKGVDLIVNNVGGTVFAECVRLLAFEGRLATVGYLDHTMTSEIDLDALHAKRLKLFGVSNKLRNAAQRSVTVRAFEQDVLPFIANGTIKPVIDRVFPFNELPAALAYVLSNQTVGKVIART